MDNKKLFDLYQKRWELIGHIQANAALQMVENKLINKMKDDIKEQRKLSKQLDLMLGNSTVTGNVLDFKENMMLRK